MTESLSSFLSKSKEIKLSISNKEKSYESCLKELKISEKNVVGMKQIHSNNFAWVGKKDLGKVIADTDALLTKEKGVFLRAVVADCIPIFFAEIGQGIISLAHSGWRGTKSEIASKVISSIKKESKSLEKLFVYLGPGARVCCYEVDKDFASLFKEKFGENVVKDKNGKSFLDLALCITVSLKWAGVGERNIFDSNICTIHNSAEYFSLRADRRNGRNIVLLGCKK